MTFERILHAMAFDLRAKIEHLHERIKHYGPDSKKAEQYRKHIALYSDLLAVVRRHDPTTIKVAKLSDVRAA